MKARLVSHILIGLTILLYLAAAVPMRYAADDYPDASPPLTGNVLYAVNSFYTGWSGRYTYGLTKTVSKLGGEGLAGLPTVVCLLGLLALLGDPALLVAGLTAMPNLIQTLYWNAGATGYGLALLGVVAMLRLKLRSGTLFLLALVVAGLSDTLAVCLPVVAVAWYLVRRERRILWAVAGSLVGLAVVAIAPGNAVRSAYFVRPDLLIAAKYAALSGASYPANALRNAPLAVTGAVMLPILRGDVERYQPGKILILLLAGLAVCFAAGLLAYYATGVPLATRAQSIPVGLCLIGAYHAARLSGMRWRRPRAAAALAGLMLIAGCLQAVSIYRVWSGVGDTRTPDISTVFP